MLSRRNVRIKVMQVLYATGRDVSTSKNNALKHYRKLIDDTFVLYLLNLAILERVSSYAKEDKLAKGRKLRPSDKDRAFSAELATNELIHSLSKNVRLLSLRQKHGFSTTLDADTIRKLYLAFDKEDVYQDYLKKAAKEKEDHIALLLDLYKFLYKHEVFTDLLLDHFPLWEDDKSLVVGAMKKTIKSLPASEDFLDAFLPDEETVKVFGEEMLLKTMTANEELLAIIQPNLNNWYADRVVILDMMKIKFL